MKLFKKLAAAALAAVLVMSLAGCGASSANMQTELINILKDQATVQGTTAKETAAMNTLAGKLLAEANKASQKEAYKNDDARDLLTDSDIAQAAGLDLTKNYAVVAMQNTQFKNNSGYLGVMLTQWMSEMINDPSEVGGYYGFDSEDDIEYGSAVGKIGDKEYVVILMVNPDSTTTSGASD